MTVVGTSERVTVQITWAGGHHSHGEVIRPVGRLDQLSYFPQPAARARELARAGHTAAAIAKILNAEGFRPPKRRDHFGPQAVRQLLQELGCVSRQEHTQRQAADPLGPDEWWPTDLARELGCPASPSTAGSRKAGSPPTNATTRAAPGPSTPTRPRSNGSASCTSRRVGAATGTPGCTTSAWNP